MWERWDSIKPDGGFQTPEMNSFNHYAYGSVGEWMYTNIAGIAAGRHRLPGDRRPPPAGRRRHLRPRHVRPPCHGPVSTRWHQRPTASPHLRRARQHDRPRCGSRGRAGPVSHTRASSCGWRTAARSTGSAPARTDSPPSRERVQVTVDARRGAAGVRPAAARGGWVGRQVPTAWRPRRPGSPTRPPVPS